MQYLVARANAQTVPITPFVGNSSYRTWLAKQNKRCQNWLKATGFAAKPGTLAFIPGKEGNIERVLLGIEDASRPWDYAILPGKLSKGRYKIDVPQTDVQANATALGFALATYQFRQYKKAGKAFASLVWPEGCDRDLIKRTIEATTLVRDLVNMPASDLGPAELAKAGQELADHHRAAYTLISGPDLIEQNFPAIYHVGKASTRPPCLLDIRWGDAKAPKLTLIGKGVVFDSGGLDLKSASGMRLMKKDMGGAANILGLAHMIMDAKLPVRLRVLIPAVENSVSGNAYRPGDVLATRKGLSVEVGNTDAEGRLILCDALHEAMTESPDLVLDIATLTGAARVALGTTLPALFSNDDAIAKNLLDSGIATHDPLWQLPLHRPYRRHLDSKIAHISNVSDQGYGGAITAALFLQEFVEKKVPWMHIDTMAWNTSSTPGRPAGGEAFSIRACYDMLVRRYLRT